MRNVWLGVTVYGLVAGTVGLRCVAALQSRPLGGLAGWFQILAPLVVLAVLSLPPLFVVRGTILDLVKVVAYTELIVIVAWVATGSGGVVERLGTFVMVLVYGSIEFVVICIPVIVVVSLLRFKR